MQVEWPYGARPANSEIYIMAVCPKCKLETTANGAGMIRQKHGRGFPKITWCPYSGPAAKLIGEPWGKGTDGVYHQSKM
jgi:hypothetical protein